MYVMINGKKEQHADQTTLAGLLDNMNIQGERVATMVNDSIIPRDQRRTLVLKDGDRVEVVVFAGGG